MSADSTFITNDANKVLKERLSELIGFSQALKFLIGFFYFSGIRELYEAIKNNPGLSGNCPRHFEYPPFPIRIPQTSRLSEQYWA